MENEQSTTEFVRCSDLKNASDRISKHLLLFHLAELTHYYMYKEQEQMTASVGMFVDIKHHSTICYIANFFSKDVSAYIYLYEDGGYYCKIIRANQEAPEFQRFCTVKNVKELQEKFNEFMGEVHNAIK